MASQYRRRSLMLNTIAKVAQGNPTIITDSSSRRLQKLNVYGQSEQDSTTGKNLLNPTGATKVGWNIKLPNFRLEVGKQYTFTAPILEGSKACGLFAIASDTELVPYLQSGKTKTFTVSEETDFSDGCLLGGIDADALTLGDELSAMVELGSVATEFEPYTGGKPSPSIEYPQEIKNAEISKITICNENLLPLDIDTKTDNNGIYFYQNLGFTLKKGIRYVLSVKSIVTGLYVVPFGETSPDTSPFKVYDGDTVEFTPTETGKYYFHAYNKDGITDEQKILWLNIGEKKPYTEHVSEQITLSEPITLRGITVDNGGNVIIDGQQYVADYIDSLTGKVNRLNGYIDSYNGDEVGTIFMSTTGQLTTGAKVIYKLSQPTQEDLPQQDQEAIRALTTYYPNTVIQTGCWNEVTYSAKRGG